MAWHGVGVGTVCLHVLAVGELALEHLEPALGEVLAGRAAVARRPAREHEREAVVVRDERLRPRHATPPRHQGRRVWARRLPECWRESGEGGGRAPRSPLPAPPRSLSRSLLAKGVSTRILGKTMRDAVKNKKSWKPTWSRPGAILFQCLYLQEAKKERRQAAAAAAGQ